MKLKIFGLVAMFACLHAGTATANSWKLSFDPTPEGLTNYLNQFEWKDGKSRVFSGLRDCRKEQNNSYGCSYGYVQITDPVRGTQLCELQKHGTTGYAIFVWNQSEYIGNGYPCRQL